MDALRSLDENLFRAIHLGWSNPFLDIVFLVASYSGLGQVQALAILVLGRFQSTKRWVVALLASEIVSGVFISDLFKQLLPRERPSNLPYAHPLEDLNYRSFPSGHTTTSFGIAFMLIYLTWSTRYRTVGLVSLVWAILVGLSRIQRGVHWPTDVLGGAFAGLLGTCLVVAWLERRGNLPLLRELVKSPNESLNEKD